MAGCYHDKQDFKSNLNIEVAREGDIVQEGQGLDEIKCKKNPGHRHFIPFKDLTLEHIPIDHRNREMLDKIKKMGGRVVRLVVDKIKNGKWIKESGSGGVFKFKNFYFIFTNNHVVKTDDEVKHCTVEFHYNDDSRSNILTSRGVELVNTCPYRDSTIFKFYPVPDFVYQLGWMGDELPDIVIMYKNNLIVALEVGSFSSKHYFSERLNLNSSLIDLMFISWLDGSFSYMKSSYFKFDPISSKLHELSSIEIHIDEDDGNSRVILGDVVKFGAEFVVKISESIFQDEVKKSRLLWNGKVIGRGTRLYFQPIKPCHLFSGIDLEIDVERGIDKCWIFEFHPIPRDQEDMLHICNKMCDMLCIGHPHGGIKMVTFGQLLGESLERFDNQGRHITQPNSDCRCKEVSCLKYSCKTCPGSSGSPVFKLNKGMNFRRRSYSHFMGERVEGFLSNGELVDNINMAWAPILYSDI